MTLNKITAEQVIAFIAEHNIGIHDAKRVLKKNAVMKAINEAETVADLKQALLYHMGED